MSFSCLAIIVLFTPGPKAVTTAGWLHNEMVSPNLVGSPEGRNPQFLLSQDKSCEGLWR